MSYVARSQSQDAEWKLVSEIHPCPICKAADGCHRDLEGAFACCARHPSDWPLTTGAWLHRIDNVEEPASGVHVTARATRSEHHHDRSPLLGSTS
ncbi:MAG: hypothetical protein ABJE95_15825 [Byssovorax sp.]